MSVWIRSKNEFLWGTCHRLEDAVKMHVTDVVIYPVRYVNF